MRKNLSVPAHNVLETLQKLSCHELICRNNLNALVKASGHSKKTVSKYLEELEKCGYIRRYLCMNEMYVVYLITSDKPKKK